LLSLARRAVEAATRQEGLDLHAWKAEYAAGTLRRPGMTFVTLYHRGRLRGCIGSLQPDKPLYLAVADSSTAAALRDPRFRPLAPRELDDLTIEVSVLSPLVSVQPEEIRVGEHGLLITRDLARGLLLPKVATEQGWNREQFLEETCAKAGLPRDAWKKGARLEAFTALVFSDEQESGFPRVSGGEDKRYNGER
jgi:AmmeMemoRadiSam system protein A